MQVQESAGKRGLRNQKRIDAKMINDDFVVDFPLSSCQKKIINVIYDMRSVKMSQLVDITGYSYNYLTQQILTLHLNRFIERIFPEKKRNEPGTKEAYFLLDQAGAIYIAGSREIQMKEVNWNRRDNLVGYDKLKHTHKISDIRARIDVEARKKGDKIFNCLADRHLYFKFKHEEKEFALRPDMYFQYVSGNKAYSYFVEVDMGTMHVLGGPNTNSFEKKVAYYEAFALSNTYKEYFNKYPRILVLTNSMERAEKLMAAVRDKQETNIEFLFTGFIAWEQMPTGGIFLKTDGNTTDIFR